MGGGVSVYQSSRQELRNNITQISRANCINVCLNNGSVEVNIINSYFKGNVNVTQLCFIEGASCILKSSLDNTLLNEQSAKLKLSLEREVDLFSFLGGFTSDDLTNENTQKIVNDITQMIESTCQNKAESKDGSVVFNVINTNFEGDINDTDEKSISNSKCVLDNIVKNYVDNSQEAELETDVKIKGSLGSIIMILILIAFIYLMVKGSKLGGSRGGPSAEDIGKAVVNAENPSN
tara:strand:- start:725 stop:1429 length:705 start_codon:yes stop_codon:yes gene_type:complete